MKKPKPRIPMPEKAPKIESSGKVYKRKSKHPMELPTKIYLFQNLITGEIHEQEGFTDGEAHARLAMKIGSAPVKYLGIKEEEYGRK